MQKLLDVAKRNKSKEKGEENTNIVEDPL